MELSLMVAPNDQRSSNSTPQVIALMKCSRDRTVDVRAEYARFDLLFWPVSKSNSGELPSICSIL